MVNGKQIKMFNNKLFVWNVSQTSYQLIKMCNAYAFKTKEISLGSKG